MGIAYGLELSGCGLGAGLLEGDREAFPPVAIDHRHGPIPSGEQQLDERHAKLRLLDGLRWVTIERPVARATYWGPPLTPDELVHPWLWPVASVFARWHGREAFHGGALIADGSAWALLGPKEAGKSTLLAAHAALGNAVLSDDLVVTDGSRAFTGPRCVDLREPLPSPLGEQLTLSPARGRTRWRIALDPLPAVAPLAGWVFVGWGSAPVLAPVAASETLRRLARWRAWSRLDSDPTVMLELAGLPAFEFSRPRSWGALEPALELLLNGLCR